MTTATASSPAEAPVEASPPKKGRRKGDKAAKPDKGGRGNLVPAVVVALGLVVGGHLMSGGRSEAASGDAAAAEEHVEEPAPEPGQIVALAPMTMNLADGRYLKVGLALQMTADAEHGAAGGHGGSDGPDASFAAPALDVAITTLGERTSAELADPARRAEVKQDLLERITGNYHGEVMGLYFTEFVMQ